MNTTDDLRAFSAGSLTASLGPDGSLRDVIVSGHRVLDAIMVATRDSRWGTAGIEVDAVEATQGADSFTVTVRSRHRNADVDVSWEITYLGMAEKLTVRAVGHPEGPQELNRAGLCLLHPPELEGEDVWTSLYRPRATAQFSGRINPVPLFTRFQRIEHSLPEGGRVTIELQGDTFEMEDHRNWTDSGWKTYSRPLVEPAPFTVTPASMLEQIVEIRFRDLKRRPRRRPVDGVTIPDPSDFVSRPALGASISRRSALSPSEVNAIRNLGLDFLCAEVSTLEGLALAQREARAVSLPLQLSLEVREAELDQWTGHLGSDLASVTVFEPKTRDTTQALLESMRRRWSGPLGGGTRGHFAELNRLHESLAAADFVQFSVAAEVHHIDDGLVMDTLLGQPAAIRDALQLAGGRPVCVAPITMRPRDVEQVPESSRWISDPRQHSSFGHVWTLGTVANFARAQSIALFQTLGDNGIVSGRDSGGLAKLIRTIADCDQISPIAPSDPRRVVGIAVRDASGDVELIVGNRTPAEVTVSVAGQPFRLAPYGIRYGISLAR